MKRSFGFEKIGMTILLAMLFVAVKQALRFLAVLGVILVAGSAFAQSMYVRANIPFSFSLNKETLPAGEYEIRAVDSAAGDHTLAITNREAKMGMMFLTNTVSSPLAPDKAKLVFKRYGDQYFLSQIWGVASVRELPISPREKELALGHAPTKAVVMAESR